MKKTLAVSLTGMLLFLNAFASDRAEKEKRLAQDVESLSIPSGIVDVYKDANGQITVYIGGRGSATANLVKVSRVKAEDHALRLAEAGASDAFTRFIQKNVVAYLDVKETITDDSVNIDDLMQKMKSVTDNEKLAGKLLPEDSAQIIKAILDRVIDSIRNASGVHSVSTLDVKQQATHAIRGMSLFGSHVGPHDDGVLGVQVFKWSPDSANFAAQAEGINKQKAIALQKGAEKLMEGLQSEKIGNKPFISHADDF